MGIRFFCPNGHKLNVKAHLAGRAGFCPECGVRLIIPYESTRKSSKELREEQQQGLEQIVEHEGGPKEDSNPKFSLEPSSFFLEEIQQQKESHASEEAHVLRASDDREINPMLQDQTVVWYIQVPNGPQYGPASGQIVHSWLQENRIGPGMLVWREGWANWLEAKNVFPELE